VVDAPLHAITTSSKSFQWGNNNQKYSDELKQKISQEIVLSFPNFQKPSEVEIDASGYVMGEVLM
jgi:hypothetical protein